MKYWVRIGAAFIMICSGFSFLFLVIAYAFNPGKGGIVSLIVFLVVSGFMFYVSGSIAVRNRVPKIMKWAK